MSRRILVIGCGYVGLPLARELMARGNVVDGWVHSAESADALKDQSFGKIFVGSIADPLVWEGVDATYDQVLHAASSGGGGPQAYVDVFLKGVSLMNRWQPRARRLLVSSTAVLAQTQGELVGEDIVEEPPTITAKTLYLAERALVGAGGLVARSSGIYGPGRRVLLEKLRRGEAVIDGDGSRWLNQIHRDDLVAALLHLLEHGQPGEVYNTTDDEPVQLRDYYAWCAQFLDRPLPPYGPVDPQRKRGLTSKRVSNAKLRATGWTPKYPTFREGYSAIGRD